ncbi:MAG: NAD(P)-binding protein [Pseudomonadota bacterium]
MSTLVKKAVKVVKKSAGGRSGGGSGGAEISPLRPRFQQKEPPCINTCPSSSDIRGWVTAIAQGESYGLTPAQSHEKAWYLLTDKNPFPAVCGRVCPHPCETNCNRHAVDHPVAINAIERSIGDYGLQNKLPLRKLTEDKRSERIAVVGAGPAGLSCAYQLARRGYPVTVFEAFPHAGGMLRYGIPVYRLPREVLDGEIAKIAELGVDIKLNTMVGKDVSYDVLRQEFRAVFVGIGAHKGLKLGAPGEDAVNVMSGVEFLHRVNAGEKVDIGSKVIVVGGGDTAIDAARVSRRLGAEVVLLYRRTRKEMPAIEPEIVGAEEEGVKLELLAAPIEVLRQGNRATGIRVQRMQLGEPDKSGRPRPVPIPGSEYTVEATTIIPAISQEPDFAGFEKLRSGKDWLKVDDRGKSSEDGTYAGGDAVALAIATTAIGHGRRAAEAIDDLLNGRVAEAPASLPLVKPERMKLGYYKQLPRNERTHLAVEERLRDGNAEVEHALSEAQLLDESKRCLSCGMCFDCETCWMYCTNGAFVKKPKGEHFGLKLEVCNGCKKCGEECPCGYIDLI